MLHMPYILAADTLERRLEFARLPSGWSGVGLIVLTVFLILAVLHLYHREQRTGASTQMRFSLAALRILVILTIATIWLEPIVATYIHRRIDARTLVLVDGSASMGMRDRYLNPSERDRVLKALPPDAATDPIEATTGLPRCRSRTTSRQMVSEPVTEPPGLSTRTTTAVTSSSAAASRSAAAIVSPPALDRPNGDSCGPPRPLTIGPATVTTAIVGLERPGSDGTGTGGPPLRVWA